MSIIDIKSHVHKYIYELGIVSCPKIINYNSETKVLVMTKINNMSVADYYGEESKNIPLNIFNQIRNIIKTLYKQGIVYPDITGYNFIEADNKIWIIDFEHAYHINDYIKDSNDFVVSFINGENSWNPSFK